MKLISLPKYFFSLGLLVSPANPANATLIAETVYNNGGFKLVNVTAGKISVLVLGSAFRQLDDVEPAPQSAMLFLMGMGLVGLGLTRRRRLNGQRLKLRGSEGESTY